MLLEIRIIIYLPPDKMYINKMKNRNAICLLTRFYNQYWVDFFNTFTDHDVYIVLDDNSKIYDGIYGNVRIVQIDDAVCRATNFYNSSIWSNLKDIVAWDRALYYFVKINTHYDHVWFMEDDVFIYNEAVLTNIDLKYPDTDLLCQFLDINHKGDVRDGWNHWIHVIHRIGTPWTHSLVCASRLSRPLLDLLGLYVRDRHLMFIEALFTTLAYQWGHSIAHPEEMQGTIHHTQEYDKNLVETTHIYHPYKKIEDHIMLRNRLRNNELSYIKDELKI